MEAGFLLYIKIIVTMINFVLWLVLGFLLWIPFLVRMIGNFVGMVAISNFTTVNMIKAENNLRFAMEFYMIGFKKILSIFEDRNEDEIVLDTEKSKDSYEIFQRILMEIGWSLLFWGSILIPIMI